MALAGLSMAAFTALVGGADDCAEYNQLAEAHFRYAATLPASASATDLMGLPGWPVDFRGRLFKKPPQSIEDIKGNVESDWSQVKIGETEYFICRLPATMARTAITVPRRSAGAFRSTPIRRIRRKRSGPSG